jgi:hypothetical protein
LSLVYSRKIGEVPSAGVADCFHDLLMPGGPMWVLRAGVVFMCAATCLMAQDKHDKKDGPTNDKARKTYQAALELLHEGRMVAALGEFKKADKQDGGHCLACQREMIHSGTRLGNWKVAELGAEEMIADVQEPKTSIDSTLPTGTRADGGGFSEEER